LKPDFSIEQAIGGRIIGIDEVGRGALSGPVVAAAVILDKQIDFTEAGVNDSKKLSRKKREELYEFITANSRWQVAFIEASIIDEINILAATKMAMEQAAKPLLSAADHILVDGNQLPDFPLPASAVVKGDQKSLSIAAASIVAKVSRDRFMQGLHVEYPVYGWHSNVGYGSAQHIEAIRNYGLTLYHRKTFLTKKQLSLFEYSSIPC